MPTSRAVPTASQSPDATGTLCLVYDAIAEGRGSIPQVVLGYVKLALEANWRVTCVANMLDDSIKNHVEWLPLYIPPKSFLVQWL